MVHSVLNLISPSLYLSEIADSLALAVLLTIIDINFDGGEKVYICVTFDNNKFSLGHIHEFVSNSLKDGWQVSFCGEDYSNAAFLCEMEEIWRELFVYCMMNMEHYTEVVYDKV
jgi:hypothetical protein